MTARPLILAPLRGVTIRAFRRSFARVLREAGFTEAVTPFISAMAGVDPLKDRELRGDEPLPLTPQFIGKDPSALRECLLRIRGAGFRTADLNAGCPFPMVRNKGRGSGLLRAPDVLQRMLEVGCETMGPGAFSLKVRLGVERPDELLKLMPRINAFPLRFLTVHGRVARQMYEGRCDRRAMDAVAAAAAMPVIFNGDLTLPVRAEESAAGEMIGRGFVRALGAREDIAELLALYLEESASELSGPHPLVGRFKELIAYWKDQPRWSRRWQVIKLARTSEELRLALPVHVRR